MSDSDIYYPKTTVTDQDSCFFYHTIDLKNGETVQGNWDMRGNEDAYFGGVDFTGKTALDVGSATGFLTFAMEERGAQVTSLDLGPGATMSRDFVPFAAFDYHAHKLASRDRRFATQKAQPDVSDEGQIARHKKQIEQEANPSANLSAAPTGSTETATTAPTEASAYINSPYVPVGSTLGPQLRGYWYSHTANASNAKVIYRSVYEMPREIGPVDVVMFGSILLHLRDPFLALHNGCRLTRETVIVTDMLHRRFKDKRNHPLAMFVPKAADKSRIGTFWLLSPEIIVQMLGVLGFEDATVTFHSQKARGAPQDMFTVVARRTAPFNPEMTY